MMCSFSEIALRTGASVLIAQRPEVSLAQTFIKHVLKVVAAVKYGERRQTIDILMKIFGASGRDALNHAKMSFTSRIAKADTVQNTDQVTGIRRQLFTSLHLDHLMSPLLILLYDEISLPVKRTIIIQRNSKLQPSIA